MKIAIVSIAVLSSAHGAVTADSFFPYIEKWEGNSPTVYRRLNETCVGIGHKLPHNEHRSYSSFDIYRFYHEDYARALDTCRVGISNFDLLPTNVQVVAMSVAWTTGRSGFMKFRKFRHLLSVGRYREAATELANSRRTSQVLLRRVADECRLLDAN